MRHLSIAEFHYLSLGCFTKLTKQEGGGVGRLESTPGPVASDYAEFPVTANNMY